MLSQEESFSAPVSAKILGPTDPTLCHLRLRHSASQRSGEKGVIKS